MTDRLAADFMLSTRPTCASCVHFVMDTPAGQGHCRIGPPRAFKIVKPVVVNLGPIARPSQQPLMEMREELSSAWPPVAADRWCGKHPDFKTWFFSNRAAIRDAIAARSPQAKAS